jgi:hypothetical protein
MERTRANRGVPDAVEAHARLMASPIAGVKKRARKTSRKKTAAKKVGRKKASRKEK